MRSGRERGIERELPWRLGRYINVAGRIDGNAARAATAGWQSIERCVRSHAIEIRQIFGNRSGGRRCAPSGFERIHVAVRPERDTKGDFEVGLLSVRVNARLNVET